METVRACVQDSFYALIATYLTSGTRDILNWYQPNNNGDGRVVLVDDTEFKIVRKLVGEKHEIPGVNVVFYDEQVQTHGSRNPRGLSKLIVVHVYIPVTKNAVADDRTLMKLQRKIDEALVPSGTQIIDFYSTPPVVGKYLFWSFLSPNESWIELTNLDIEQHLHRSRNVMSYYDDAVV